MDTESHGDTTMDTKKKGVITATKADFTADQSNQIQYASHSGPSFQASLTAVMVPHRSNAATWSFPGLSMSLELFAGGANRPAILDQTPIARLSAVR